MSKDVAPTTTSRWFGKLTSMLGMEGEPGMERGGKETAEKLEKGKEYYGRLFTSMSPANSPPCSFDVDEGIEREMTQEQMAVADYKASMRIEELMTFFLGDWMERDLDEEGLDIAGAFLEYAVEASDMTDVAKDRMDRRESKKNKKRMAKSRPRVKGTSSGPPELYQDIDIPKLSEMVNINKTLTAINEYDEALRCAETETGRMKTVPTFPAAHVKAVETVYDHILTTFQLPKYKRLYGYNKQDHTAAPLKAGSPVPSYFANVKDQSIHRRKVLSLAGLRNLVKEGSVIYKQMQAQLFVGDPGAYAGDKGINKMKQVTGNVVDLDTCVLRPSDSLTMKAINAFNAKQGGKAWHSADEFGESEQAADIAETAAVTLLTQFINDYKLSEKDAKGRNVSPAQFNRPVPLAKSNTDRGKWPMWHYVNVGQNSFHVNVPTIADVNGALLKAPLHCAKIYLTFHMTCGTQEALEEKLDAFYEDAVADSCFNMKWKAIEEFAMSMSHEGTITDVLQKLSVAHQAALSSIMDADDDNYTKEKEKIWEIVAAGDLHGRSVAGGKDVFRKIEKCDVEKWVDDPSIEL
eukprot:TRINITY_DN38279_c0_g1_i1.p1 TRINITY_DN38279_c0_g1~~TRINITY_DN38279_c0_g1_i1.p1  ORF type:complete len:592 (+),score=218.56 TRINITY_DN38279_c0_g1_i1:47-1777(+)